MKRDEEILNGGRSVSRRLATARFWVRPCWALLDLFLFSGLGACPAGAAGLDIVWTRSASTARPAIVAFSPDGRTVASGTEKIQLWRTTDGSLVRTLAEVQGALSVTFSPDGQILASGDLYGSGRLWRVSDGQLLRTYDQEASDFAFTPDNQMLAVVGKSDTIQLSKLIDGTHVRTFDPGKGWTGPHMALSPDGQTIALAAIDTRMWRVSDGQLLHTFSVHFPLMVAFSPDSQMLAFSDENTVFLWRVADGTLLRTLTGHRYAVGSAAFSKDGKILVTSSDDLYTAGKRRGEINFWSVENGQLLQSYDPGAGVMTIALSPDDLLLTYGLDDGSVVVARNPYAPGQ